MKRVSVTRFWCDGLCDSIITSFAPTVVFNIVYQFDTQATSLGMKVNRNLHSRWLGFLSIGRKDKNTSVVDRCGCTQSQWSRFENNPIRVYTVACTATPMDLPGMTTIFHCQLPEFSDMPTRVVARRGIVFMKCVMLGIFNRDSGDGFDLAEAFCGLKTEQ